MKKSFVVQFPIQQDISAGLSWAQMNQKSWIEINLLSWKGITKIAKRYLAYSIYLAQKYINNAVFTLKKVR